MSPNLCDNVQTSSTYPSTYSELSFALSVKETVENYFYITLLLVVTKILSITNIFAEFVHMCDLKADIWLIVVGCWI